MRILQITASSEGGGAEVVAKRLHEQYLAMGHDAHILAGYQRSDYPNLHGIVDVRTRLGRVRQQVLLHAERITGVQGVFSTLLGRWFQRNPQAWDVIHCHNLHGAAYASFRDLLRCAPGTPMVLTLHDLWMLTGHCAYPVECERFRQGCDRCPDLKRYVRVHRDRTAANLRHKKRFIHARKPVLVGVSRWVSEQVETSCLDWPCRTIPNGIDTDRFVPRPRDEVRAELGLPRDIPLVLYVVSGGLGILGNRGYKRPEQVLEMCRLLKARLGSDGFRLVVVGGHGAVPPGLEDVIQQVGRVDKGLENYYAAAEVTVHASSADTFGLVLAESMACGTPVVTTDRGGCPEVAGEGEGGLVVPLDDAEAMCNAVQSILADRSGTMRDAARKRVERLFSWKNTYTRYLELYEELRRSPPPG